MTPSSLFNQSGAAVTSPERRETAPARGIGCRLTHTIAERPSPLHACAGATVVGTVRSHTDWTTPARSRRRSSDRITGVASVPWTMTESRIVKATVDHSQRSSENACSPAASAR